MAAQRTEFLRYAPDAGSRTSPSLAAIECIAVERDLWFEGLGFPTPPMPAKDQTRGAKFRRQQRHQAVALALECLASATRGHDRT